VAWSYGCYVWLVFLALVFTCGGLSILLGRPSLGRRIARFGVGLLFRVIGMPLTVAGLDRLPSRPHVLLVNHTSFLDALALIALLPSTPGYAFTTKQQFRSQRMLCPLVRSVGTVVLENTGVRHGAPNVERMAAILRIGINLVVFPEGAFRPEPGLQPFHAGAFVAALRAHAPLVTAGLRGARTALPLGTWMPRRTAIHLEIGSAFVVPDDADQATIDQFIAATHHGIAALCGESAS